MGIVSIIVAVYNAEKYIHKCLDSILAQTYSDFEVILVDDGSPDGSGKICDEYVAKDTRFKVIHQPNGGVSVARQTGLDVAQGEYVIHVDPDDWIEANMLEELVIKIEEDGADMVFCDYWEENEDKTKYIKQFDDTNISSSELIERYFMHTSNALAVLWDKLYRRTSIKKISFTPGLSYGEDTIFNLYALCNGIKISYLPHAFYHYKKYKNSLTASFSNKRIKSVILFIDELSIICREEKIIKIEHVNKIKKDYLFDLFLNKYYNLLSKTYVEIHSDLINNGTPYRWYMPNSSCLAIALKGYPHIAHLLYKMNLIFVKIKELIQRLLS